MNVIKRNGKEVTFDIDRIVRAITKANEEYSELTPEQITDIANKVLIKCKKLNRAINVEEIQDMVEDALIKINAYQVSKHYIKYRYQKDIERKRNTTDTQILTTVNLENEEVKQENSNKNPAIISTQRDYVAGLVSRDLTNRYLLPEDISKAHKEGIIHFHDSDYFIHHIHNCDLWDLEDMLQNGTVINGVKIEKPHSFSTACNVATQIMAIVASSQYGGQTITLSHLAPFVDVSRQRIRREVQNEVVENGLNCTEEVISKITESRLKEEIRKSVQLIQYQILTLNSSNGQTPFVSICMYLNEVSDPVTKADLATIIEEVLKQRIQGIKNESGHWITPAFPKLLYVLEEDNIHKDSKYWYLTELAAKCTAKRMVPDYISEKMMKQNKIDKDGNGNCFPCMGCRSFLTPYIEHKVVKDTDHLWDKAISEGAVPDSENKIYPVNMTYKCESFNGAIKDHQVQYLQKLEDGSVDIHLSLSRYYSRFNQGVVTLNLPDIALSSKKSEDKFWKLFEERCELAHRALRIRHERLKGTLSDMAPILWQYGALARLKKGETIDKLLYNGYSTISLGYAGLWECVYYMTGKKLTEEEGKEFGLKVMQKLNEFTNKWKVAENIDYSLYGTPIESTTQKFAHCLQQRFGIIPGVTDKNYITNSYHVHVTEHIDAFSKLKLESEFQLLSPGGAISYVEVPNMQDNIPAVEAVIQFIYDNIVYAELNTKSDYCQVCGYDGEIKIVEDENGKLVWECPCCHNRDQSKMNVARRTCGYIGTQYWNAGRTQEIKERVLHL